MGRSWRGHTFYFFAGPGHFDIEMAFEEMGVFGSPLRQAMNFDFYFDDDKLASHNTIVSQGALARNHTDGDFPWPAPAMPIRPFLPPQESRGNPGQERLSPRLPVRTPRSQRKMRTTHFAQPGSSLRIPESFHLIPGFNDHDS